MNQQGGGRTGGSRSDDMVNDYSVNRIKEMIKKYKDTNDYERLLDQVQVESRYLQDGGRVANMVERLYQELENGMTDDEKSDLRKNLMIILINKESFYKVKFQKESYLKKINKKFNIFQGPELH